MPLLALLLAALAAAICFDARPGVNWPLWTIPAAVGLWYFAGSRRRAVALPLALVALLATGAAVTGSSGAIAAILIGSMVLMATAMRLAGGAPAERAGAAFIAAAPLRGAFETVAESWRRSGELARDGRTRESLPVARGVVLAVPLLLLLWVLLAQADPHMSAWGGAFMAWIEALAFVPRLIFGAAMFVLVFGAYGIALRGALADAPAASGVPAITLGAVERAIVLGAAGSVLALFVALQLSYFFGDPAGTAGTGVTYAEWAHRGFAELTLAAAIIVVLVVLLHTHAARGSEALERVIRALSLALVALTALVVLSAFRRIALYEAAYGYTVMRVWSQAFMIGTGVALGLLAWEIADGLDARRLARRTAATAAVMLAGLAFWNHEAFIVRRNVARFAGTPKLDVAYLGYSLSVDAVPALLAARGAMPAEQAAQVTKCLNWRRNFDHEFSAGPWYEYNVRRAAAIEAMKSLEPDPGADGKGCMGWKD